MAASIATTAVTLEGQILEVLRNAQTAELAYNADPANVDNQVNNVSIALDAEAGTFSATVTLPVTFGGVGGQIAVNAGTYLP